MSVQDTNQLARKRLIDSLAELIVRQHRRMTRETESPQQSSDSQRAADSENATTTRPVIGPLDDLEHDPGGAGK